MSHFSSLDDLRAACRALPMGDEDAASAVAERQGRLTKPPGSLGRLEALVAWMARWQRRPMPRLDHVDVLVFAGNHGVTARGVSAYPAEVTAQMVANFQAGGAAINQLAAVGGADLRVLPLELDRPTNDIVTAPAMEAGEFLDAVTVGFDAVSPELDLVCLGEMGIGNTTIASAMAAGLFGTQYRWAGAGTGLDTEGIARKQAVVDAALALHGGGRIALDPIGVAQALGGRELAAILGATLAARLHGVPVVLDGFVCTAAAAPLACLTPGGLDHALLSHASAEAMHPDLARLLNLTPVLDLGLRLGEASGAALVLPLLRAALACHAGMATFAEAQVSDRA